MANNNIRKKIQDALSSEFIAGTVYRIDIDRVDVAPVGSPGIIRSLPLTGDRDKVKTGDTVKVVTVAGQRVALAGDVALDAATAAEAVGGLSDDQAALLNNLAAVYGIDNSAGDAQLAGVGLDAISLNGVFPATSGTTQHIVETDMSGGLTVDGPLTANGNITAGNLTASGSVMFNAPGSLAVGGTTNLNGVNNFSSGTSTTGTGRTNISAGAGTPAILSFQHGFKFGNLILDTDEIFKLYSSQNGGPYKLWHAGNMGPSSGLNADLLDGSEASAFAPASHTHQQYYFEVCRNTALTVTNTTWTNIGWNQILSNSGGFGWNGSYDGGAYNVPVTGVYIVSVYSMGTFAQNGGTISFHKNGTAIGNSFIGPTHSYQPWDTAMQIMICNAGEAIGIQVYQQTGSNKQMDASIFMRIAKAG